MWICIVPCHDHTSKALRYGTRLLTPEEWKAELALGGWLVTYRYKCRAPGTEPGHGRPSQY